MGNTKLGVNIGISKIEALFCTGQQKKKKKKRRELLELVGHLQYYFSIGPVKKNFLCLGSIFESFLNETINKLCKNTVLVTLTNIEKWITISENS